MKNIILVLSLFYIVACLKNEIPTKDNSILNSLSYGGEVLLVENREYSKTTNYLVAYFNNEITAAKISLNSSKAPECKVLRVASKNILQSRQSNSLYIGGIKLIDELGAFVEIPYIANDNMYYKNFDFPNNSNSYLIQNEGYQQHKSVSLPLLFPSAFTEISWNNNPIPNTIGEVFLTNNSISWKKETKSNLPALILFDLAYPYDDPQWILRCLVLEDNLPIVQGRVQFEVNDSDLNLARGVFASLDVMRINAVILEQRIGTVLSLYGMRKISALLKQVE